VFHNFSLPPTVKSTNRKHDQNYIDNHSHNNFFKFAPASKYFGGKPKNELPGMNGFTPEQKKLPNAKKYSTAK